MKEELKRELKAYVFAQYIGQKVMRYKENSFKLFEVKYSSLKYPNILGVYLQLRALSSIIDQEAIEVAKLMGIYNSAYGKAYYRREIDSYFNGGITHCWHPRKHIAIDSYLKSIGVAVEIWFKGVQYSVEDLVAEGIITIKS